MTAKEAVAIAFDELGIGFAEDADGVKSASAAVVKPDAATQGNVKDTGKTDKPASEKSLAERLATHECEAQTPDRCGLRREMKNQLKQQMIQKGLSEEDADKESDRLADQLHGNPSEAAKYFAKTDGELATPETVQIGNANLTVMTETSKAKAEELKQLAEHPKDAAMAQRAKEAIEQLSQNPATNGMSQPEDFTPEEAKQKLGEAAPTNAQQTANPGEQTNTALNDAQTAAAAVRSANGQLNALKSQYEQDITAWNQKWQQAAASGQSINESAKAAELSKIDAKYLREVDKVDPYHNPDGSEETIADHLKHCKAQDPKAENCPFLKKQKDDGKWDGVTGLNVSAPQPQPQQTSAAQPAPTTQAATATPPNTPPNQPPANPPNNPPNTPPSTPPNNPPNGGNGTGATPQQPSSTPQQQQPSEEQQKPTGQVKQVRVNGKTYVDVSEVGFWKGMAESFKAGWQGKEIITAWDKLNGMDPSKMSGAQTSVVGALKDMMPSNLMRETIESFQNIDPMVKMELSSLVDEYDAAKNPSARTSAIRKFNAALERYGLKEQKNASTENASSTNGVIETSADRVGSLSADVLPDETIQQGQSSNEQQVVNRILEKSGLSDASKIDIQRTPKTTRFSFQGPWQEMPKKGDMDRLKNAILYQFPKHSDGQTVACDIDQNTGRVTVTISNDQEGTVSFKPILKSEEWNQVKQRGGIPLAMGQDRDGKNVVADLKKLVHVLFAGTTGSGKTARLDQVIGSIVMGNTPDEVQIIGIDPKQVAFQKWKNAPHFRKTITNMDESAKEFENLVNEQERRFNLFQQAGVEDIDAYNEKGRNGQLPQGFPKHLPSLALVCDELSYLMATHGKQIESNIVRLGNTARAAGIHLVLATQSPRAEVLTGKLLANIPSTVGLHAKNSTESRIIGISNLDTLPGKGPMILKDSDGNLTQIDGAFLNDENVRRISTAAQSEYSEGGNWGRRDSTPGSPTPPAAPTQPQQPTPPPTAPTQEPTNPTPPPAAQSQQPPTWSDIPRDNGDLSPDEDGYEPQGGGTSDNPNPPTDEPEETMTAEEAAEAARNVIPWLKEKGTTAVPTASSETPSAQSTAATQPAKQQSHMDVINSPEARKARAKSDLDTEAKKLEKLRLSEGKNRISEEEFQRRNKELQDRYDQALKDIDAGLSPEDISKREADKKAAAEAEEDRLAKTVVTESNGRPRPGAVPHKGRGNPDAFKKVKKSDVTRVEELMPDGWTLELDKDKDGNVIQDGFGKVVVRHPRNGSYGWVNLRTGKFIPGVNTTHAEYKGEKSEEAKAAKEHRDSFDMDDPQWDEAHKAYNRVAFGHDEAIPYNIILDAAIEEALG